MGEASHARADRRRLARLQAAVDRIVDGDRAYFARHHDRRHRLRVAGGPEIEMLAHVHGPYELRLAPGERFYCVVKEIAPGCRVRHFAANVGGIETDLPESYCTALFDHLAPKGSAAASAVETVEVMSKNLRGAQ